jgi:hypothetical protein
MIWRKSERFLAPPLGHTIVMRHFLLLVTFVGLFCMTLTASAANWTGSNDGITWSNSGNWNPVGVPTAANDVTINLASGDSNVMIASGVAGAGKILDISWVPVATGKDSLTVAAGCSYTGVSSIRVGAGGVLIVEGMVQSFNIIANYSSLIQIDGNGLFNDTGGFWYVANGAKLIINGNGTFRTVGGTGGAVSSFTAGDWAAPNLITINDNGKMQIRGNKSTELATALTNKWIVTQDIFKRLVVSYEPTAGIFGTQGTTTVTTGRIEPRFGFTYWPAGYSCNVLYDENWTAENKAIVESDIDTMASYSTSLLRLMVWPQVSGYLLYNGTNGGHWGDGGFFNSDFDEVTTNFLDIVQMCHERGIKILLSFGNSYHTSLYQETPKIYWWELGYGDNSSGLLNFCADSTTWENGFIDKIEASPWADTVIYYDYHPEWSSLRHGTAEYITYLYDHTHVPAGKRYISPLILNDWHNDANELKLALGSRIVDVIDFHVYPYDDFCADIEYCYGLVHAAYPSSQVYIGECGSSGDSNEPAQQSVVLDISQRARALKLEGFTHWMLWDNAPPNPRAIYAWGYDADTPKDVMGGMAELFSLAPNSDMEHLFGNQPQNWTAGGTVPLTFNDSNSSPAANSYCARIQVNNTSGKAWMTSALIPVQSGKKLFVNFYVRASMNNVGVTVSEYDANKNELAKIVGPTFSPLQWKWYGYMRNIGSWFAPLSDQTRFITISIGGAVNSNPSILDVDAVAVWQADSESLRSDFNYDSKVDYLDLMELTDAWLTADGQESWHNAIDVSLPQDHTINLKDVASFAREWLKIPQ